MGILDTPLRQAASVILNVLGIDGVLKHVTDGTYDAVAGTTTDSVTTTYNVKCKPPKNVNKFSKFDSVQQGDSSTMIPALGLEITPMPGDTISIAGVVWKIVQVLPASSGDQDAAYNIQLRR